MHRTSCRHPTLRLALLLLIATAWPVGGASAQISPFTFEARGGAAIPVEELSDPGGSWVGEVDPGPSFGMDFAYTFRSWGAVYSGFSQHRYGCGASACGRERDVAATGFDVGLRLIFGSGRVIPLVRTGVVTYKVAASVPESGGGSRDVTSHRAVGGEAGLGLTVRLGPSVVLTPGVRYLTMTADFGADGEMPMSSVIGDVGFMLAF